jgi:hypothetical protein
MKKIFFADQYTREILKEFNIKLKQIKTTDEFLNQRNKHILKITNSMEKSPDQWDDACQINIEWIGNNFLNTLKEKNNLDDGYLYNVYEFCFRFINELYLSTKNELEIEFSIARKFVIENIDRFPESMRGKIEYALLEMPISIFKKIANSDEINNLKDLSGLYKNIENLQKELNSDLEAREGRVNILRDKLETYKTGFNFVGLHQGFDELAVSKNREKNILLLLLAILAILTFFPIIFELIYIKNFDKDFSLLKTYMLLAAVPSLSFMFLCIYYFRVVLYNYKRVSSQILQIELRKTLCRFIQSYAEYSAQIKENNKTSLDKFEGIIFSSIVSDEENLPSVYDGIEHIAKLIKNN